MTETESKPQPKRCWYQHVAFVLIAIFLVAADKKRESQPDLHKYVWSGYSAEEREEVIVYLRKRSDDELKKVLDDILKLTKFRTKSGYEPCLSEVIRRGGMQWEAYLRERFDTLMKSEVKRNERGDKTEPGVHSNLEILTALRRVAKQPDPLQIQIVGPKELIGTGSALPILKVKLKNVDAEKASIGITEGGDSRSGRQERWRILVQDEKGNEIPERGSPSAIGGGQSMEGILEHGQSWKTSLDVRSFIEVPPPGKYTLTVYYHNSHEIAGESSVEGLIVSRSKPVTLVVNRLTITHGKKDREAVRKLIAELDGNKSLKIVAGTYGDWAHEFIASETPEGKLLSMGFEAVPTIIESLRDEDMTPKKRAWLFAILFSLTSENDPRWAGGLGDYEYWEGGWEIWGGRSDDEQSGVLSAGSRGSRFSLEGGEIASESQEKLIKTWDEWLKKVEVKERDAEHEEPNREKSGGRSND